MSEYVRVSCRIRPKQSLTQGAIKAFSSKQIEVGFLDKSQHFELDNVFGPSASQAELFNGVAKRVIDGALEGFNGTIFAYGQTGSGKTHTIVGPASNITDFTHPENKGIIPRAAEVLFDLLEQKKQTLGETFTFTVTVQFVQLYNEEWFDLLNNNVKLRLRLGKDKEPFLENSCKEPVESSLDIVQVLLRGWTSRNTAETMMNQHSSRSHALFIVNVVTEELEDDVVNKKVAVVNIVDLAGSERVSQTGAVGDRFQEGCYINQSLLVLSRVIRQLNEQKQKTASYRDSALTHYLRNSLGGNARTAVVVTIHPDKEYFNDTHSTLNFASSVRRIRNQLHANEAVTGNSVLALEAQVNKLREQLRNNEHAIKEELEKQYQPYVEKASKYDEVKLQLEESRMETDRCRLLIKLKLNGAQHNSVSEGDKENNPMEVDSSFDAVAQSYLDEMKKYYAMDNSELVEQVKKLTSETECLRSSYEQLKRRYDDAQQLYSSPLRNTANTPALKRTLDPVASSSRSRKDKRRTLYALSDVVRRSVARGKQLQFDDDDDTKLPEHIHVAHELRDEGDERKRVGEQIGIERVTELELEVNQLHQVIANREEELLKMSEVHNNKLKEVQREIGELTSEKAQLLDNVSKVEEKLTSRNEKLSQANVNVQRLMSTKTQLEGENNRLEKDLFNSQTLVDDLRSSMAQMRALVQQKEEEVSALKVSLLTNSEQLSAASDSLVKVTEERDIYKHSVTEAEQKLSALVEEKCRSEVSSDVELTKTRNEMEELKHSLTEAEQKVSALVEEKCRAEMSSDVELTKTRKRLEELQNSLETKDAALAEEKEKLNVSERKLAKTSAKLSNLTVEKESLAKEIGDVSNQLTLLQEEVSSLRSDREGAFETVAQMELKLKREKEQYGVMEDLLRGKIEVLEADLVDMKNLQARVLEDTETITAIRAQLQEKIVVESDLKNMVNELEDSLSATKTELKDAIRMRKEDAARYKTESAEKLQKAQCVTDELKATITELQSRNDSLEKHLQGEKARYVATLDELKAEYTSKVRRMTIDTDAQQDNLRKEKTELEEKLQLWRENCAESEVALTEAKDQLHLRTQELAIVKTERDRAVEEVVVLTGHSNRNQKVQMMQRYKDIIAEKTEKEVQLTHALAKANTALEKNGLAQVLVGSVMAGASSSRSGYSLPTQSQGRQLRPRAEK